jgi:hypothetical protein
LPEVEDCEKALASLDPLLSCAIREHIHELYQEGEPVVAELIALKIEGKILLATLKFSPHTKYGVQKLQKIYNDLNSGRLRPAPPLKYEVEGPKLSPLLSLDNVEAAMQRWPNPNGLPPIQTEFPRLMRDGEGNGNQDPMNGETTIAIVWNQELGVLEGSGDKSVGDGGEDGEAWDNITVQDVD